MLHYLQKYYMLYPTICTYNITFLIVVMVIITVCYLLGTLLEGVEVCRFNKCTKFLLIFSDEVWFACWPCSYFLRKILSVGFCDLAMKQDMIHGSVFITTSALCVLTQRSSYWHSYEVWQQKCFCEFDVLMVVTVSVLWNLMGWRQGYRNLLPPGTVQGRGAFKFRHRFLGRWEETGTDWTGRILLWIKLV
jgi:hypothetical protein